MSKWMCPICGEPMLSFWHVETQGHITKPQAEEVFARDVFHYPCLCGRSFKTIGGRLEHFAGEGRTCFLLYQLGSS